MNSKSAVVTVGAGFIDSHLVDGLLERGYRVTALDDLSTGKLENTAHILNPTNPKNSSNPRDSTSGRQRRGGFAIERYRIAPSLLPKSHRPLSAQSRRRPRNTFTDEVFG